MTQAIEYSVLEKKTDLFLGLLALKTARDVLKDKIIRHLSENGQLAYVLFRHSSLYFFIADQVSTIENTADQYAKADYLRFDGRKISTLDPEYYLGAARTPAAVAGTFSPVATGVAATVGFSFFFGVEADSSNNNNNNNNNGNNNNG
ncbi:hypothetical protein [Thioflexithrix psekupsensis]|uniref:Uncharacterized protein n=1 Tax=Thioflexithrix psekupsensis TaxID=1570016 RepID=A0A251X7E4_9GAMM|nr:hypothetical protein [Thioflexithrix psekupsensis]OUD13901.1 hypothetical protein TPSD3_06030 [Thioflexithrix psekupsensis]